MEAKIKEIIRLREGQENTLVRVNFSELLISKDKFLQILPILNELKNKISEIEVENFLEGKAVHKHDYCYTGSDTIEIACKCETVQDDMDLFDFDVKVVDKYVEVEGTRIYSMLDDIKAMWDSSIEKDAEEQ